MESSPRQTQLGSKDTQTALAPARFVKRDVKAALCFLKDNEDGSPPHSAYIDRLETLDPPCLTYDMTIDDVCGQEDKYTMDGQDFRICRLPAAEKTFRDDEIKASCYPERGQVAPVAEEVLLIKCFDSKMDGLARRVPHAAFMDPTAAPDAPPRDSIEVQCLVIHPDARERLI
ncbi:hypothetical protein S40293_08255 [Stachybotrys chartarum IBT 40293]|nr:hypothetical protein S40293_08255 [Stachybotrys chartarum IBT 40293]